MLKNFVELKNKKTEPDCKERKINVTRKIEFIDQLECQIKILLDKNLCNFTSSSEISKRSRAFVIIVIM